MITVLLLYTTVPAYGLLAAAVASAIGYAAMFISVYIYARRQASPISYDRGKLIRVSAVGSAAYVGAAPTASPTSSVGAVERIARVVVGAALALTIGGVRLSRVRPNRGR